MNLMFCTIKKRPEFLRISKEGKRYYGEHFLVQALPNPQLSGIFRIGYVATRKTGNAVKRNKAKRRLRSLVFQMKDQFQLGCDYVFVARSSLWSVKFEILQQDFSHTLKKVVKTSASGNHATVNRIDLPLSHNS